jgi:hypothetical protein
MGEKENKNKSKAVALAMVVSMVLANPLFETGCEKKPPRVVVDEEEMQKEEQQNNSSSPIISGGGGYHTPFIFHSYSTSSSGETISNGGWKSWSASTIEKGGYSGVHLSSSLS